VDVDVKKRPSGNQPPSSLPICLDRTNFGEKSFPLRHCLASPPITTNFATATEMSFLGFTSLICLLLPLVLAQHDHGMDYMDDMDGMGGMEGGTMKMHLHFTPGDSVFFGPWIPNTGQAVFGTCIGVFMLAVVDRWFSAIAAVMNAYWNKK